MYVRPPGYNAESAKAAEIADASQPPAAAASSSSNSMHPEAVAGDHKKKPRPKDAFGRPLPTQEEFQVLTNAPRLETGVPARVKPFGIEVRNVKCLRCGKYGHQSGDRECPLKDPLKWELKQKTRNQSSRGGFNPDDPNQQIVAEDIFDEYGGFLSGGNIPDLLTNFSPKSLHQVEKYGRKWAILTFQQGGEEIKRREEKKKKRKGWIILNQAHPKDFMFDRHPKRNKHRHSYSSEQKKKISYSTVHFHSERRHRSGRDKQSYSHLSTDSKSDRQRRGEKSFLAATSIGLIHNQKEFVGVIAFPLKH
uniref:Zinc knuckle domain-containing protein n=1 Tax=Salix viminalis TaxID=40686 RepID=A0A6N2KJK6_SALVM